MDDSNAATTLSFALPWVRLNGRSSLGTRRYREHPRRGGSGSAPRVDTIDGRRDGSEGETDRGRIEVVGWLDASASSAAGVRRRSASFAVSIVADIVLRARRTRDLRPLADWDVRATEATREIFYSVGSGTVSPSSSLRMRNHWLEWPPPSRQEAQLGTFSLSAC